MINYKGNSIDYRRLGILMFVVLLSGVLSEARSQGPFITEENKNTANNQPEIQKLKNGKLAIGKVTIDPAQHSMSFPAKVEILEEPLEYALVHHSGKVHEALFSTATRARSMHIAALLLNAENKKPQVEVSWKKDGMDIRHPLKDLVKFSDEVPELLTSPWFYTGSAMHASEFGAELTGSLIALMYDPDALINIPASQKTNRDDVFSSKVALLPEKASPVMVHIIFSK